MVQLRLLRAGKQENRLVVGLALTNVFAKRGVSALSTMCKVFAHNHGVLWPNVKEQAMKVHFDQDSNAVYFKLEDSAVIDLEEVKPGVIWDFNEKNHLVGIEILLVRDRVPEANLKQMHFKVV